MRGACVEDFLIGKLLISGGGGWFGGSLGFVLLCVDFWVLGFPDGDRSAVAMWVLVFWQWFGWADFGVFCWVWIWDSWACSVAFESLFTWRVDII